MTREEKIQAAIEAAMERARNDPVNREAFVYLWYDGYRHLLCIWFDHTSDIHLLRVSQDD